MFDLKSWAGAEKPTHHTYAIKGVGNTSLLVQRSDRPTTQQFTKATFAALLKEGRLEIIDNTTFKVEIDTTYDPSKGFSSIDDLMQ